MYRRFGLWLSQGGVASASADAVVVRRPRMFVRCNSTSLITDVASEYVTNSANRVACVDLMKKAPAVNMAEKNPAVHAAVLIPVCQDSDGRWSLLYTLRSSKLRRHVREVSFPGGVKDSTDQSYEECALRETEEEIGWPRNRVEIWGTGQLLTTTRGPAIMPVIGSFIDFRMNELKLNPDEVEKAFTVPIDHLSLLNNRRHTQFRTGYSVPVFLGGEERIWGITAVITTLFLSSLLPKTIFRPNIVFLSKYRPPKANSR